MTLDYEATIRRMNQAVDWEAVLRELSPAELEFFIRQAATFSAMRSKGAAQFGGALGTMLDSQLARREWATARVDSEFWAIIAYNFRPEPSDADMTGLPKWSEISP